MILKTTLEWQHFQFNSFVKAKPNPECNCFKTLNGQKQALEKKSAFLHSVCTMSFAIVDDLKLFIR